MTVTEPVDAGYSSGLGAGYFYNMEKLIVLLSFLLALLSGTVAAQNLRGSWQGTVELTCRSERCDTQTVSVSLNGPTGTIQYPGTACTGTLSFENKTGEVYYYRERITKGNCTQGAIIAIMPVEKGIQWTWNSSKGCLAGTLYGQRRLPSCSECNILRDKCLAECDIITQAGDKTDCRQKCKEEFACKQDDDCR